MKHRKKIIALAFIAALTVIIFCLWFYTHSPKFRARQLLSELRQLNESRGRMAQFLIDIDFLHDDQDRNADDIMEDLVVQGPPAVSVLIPALKDEDSLVQIMVARALGRIGPPAYSAIPALIEVLNTNQNIEFQAEVALALGEIGSDALPYLLELKEDEDIQKKLLAVMALVKIDKDFGDDQVISFLMGILNDENSELGVWSIWALGEIGPASQKAVPVLSQAWNDQDDRTFRYILEALIKIGKPSIPQLIKSLNDKDKNIQFSAAWALTSIDPTIATREKLDILKILLRDEGVNLQVNVVILLGLMGPEARPAVPSLIQALDEEDKYLKQFIITTLIN